MVLTNERAEMLANYLKADPQKTKELLDTPVDEALARINSEGYDFTVEELKAFDQAMVDATGNEDGELSADALESVAGGFLSVASAALVVSIVSYGAPYAWKAGQWIGKQVVSRRRR